MSSHSAAAATAACHRPFNPFRSLAFAWLLVPALSVMVAASAENPLYLWVFPGLWCVAVPLLDTLLPVAEPVRADDNGIIGEADGETSWLLRLMVPAAYFDLFALTGFVAASVPEFNAILAAGLSLAIVFGIVVLNVRHFVPPRDKFDAILAGLATSLLAWPFYCRTIAIAHHRCCATPADPMSARMGEGFWKFVYRAVSGTLSEAWHRLRRRALREHPVAGVARSRTTAEILFTVALYGAVSAWAGVAGVVMLTVAWCGAFVMVLAAHYVQHYGLLRPKRTDGAYARVTAAHAWDDPHRVSSVLTLNLGCHAHVHTAPHRDPHHHCLDESPKLPLGFAAALILATIPPAWFAVMNPRVAQWAKGDLQRVNIDGGAYATLMARYHRPGGG